MARKRKKQTLQLQPQHGKPRPPNHSLPSGPTVETGSTASIAILLTPKCAEEVEALLIDSLTQSGLEAVLQAASRAIIVRASLLQLENEAGRLHIVKADSDAIMRTYSAADDGDAAECLSSSPVPLAAASLGPSLGHLNHPAPFPGLTSSEQMYLLQSLVDSVEWRRSRHRFMAVMSKLRHGERALHVAHTVNALMHAGMVEGVVPLHNGVGLKASWTKSWKKLGLVDVDAINDYFGPSQSFYFLWMVFYIKWLAVPTVIGTMMYFYRRLITRVTIDDDKNAPIFGLFMVIWAVAFQKFWRRTAAEASWRWGTLLEHESLDVLVPIRPEFTGAEIISPVTGRKDRYFSPMQRAPRYLVSVAVTSIMLLLAVAIIACCLNMEGYVNNNNSNSLEGSIYIPRLAQLAEPGGLFDVNGLWLGFLPRSVGATVCHVVAIQALNRVYRVVATWLTDNENHRTEAEWEQALLVKRFMFEAFDCYSSLFYIAFAMFEIEKLRNEIFSLYMVDSARRVFVETILPSVLQSLSHREGVKGMINAKKNGADDLEQQLKSDHYESFDDFLEMVIQFGYITLFASAFPLAAAISLVATVLELKSDHVHLFFVVRRPKVERQCNIGAWVGVMDTLAALSILTNVLIFGLTSDQIVQWLPATHFFDLEGDNDQEFRPGMGRFVVGTMFAIEHTVFVLLLILWHCIPDVPEEVSNKMKRWHYRREQASKRVGDNAGADRTKKVNGGSSTVKLD